MEQERLECQVLLLDYVRHMHLKQPNDLKYKIVTMSVK